MSVYRALWGWCRGNGAVGIGDETKAHRQPARRNVTRTLLGAAVGRRGRAFHGSPLLTSVIGRTNGESGVRERSRQRRMRATSVLTTCHA